MSSAIAATQAAPFAGSRASNLRAACSSTPKAQPLRAPLRSTWHLRGAQLLQAQRASRLPEGRGSRLRVSALFERFTVSRDGAGAQLHAQTPPQHLPLSDHDLPPPAPGLVARLPRADGVLPRHLTSPRGPSLAFRRSAALRASCWRRRRRGGLTRSRRVAGLGGAGRSRGRRQGAGARRLPLHCSQHPALPALPCCRATGQHGAHPAGPDRRGRRQGRLHGHRPHGAPAQGLPQPTQPPALPSPPCCHARAVSAATHPPTQSPHHPPTHLCARPVCAGGRGTQGDGEHSGQGAARAAQGPALQVASWLAGCGWPRRAALRG